MKLIDALRPEAIMVSAEAADKKEVLRLVAQCAKKCPLLASTETDGIVQALEEREKLGSTGFGKGIAIPHCRLESVSDFVVGILTIPNGIHFDALDQKPVKLIAFIIAPADASNAHLRLLSAISQTLHEDSTVKEIVASTNPEVVRECFLRHAPGQLDMAGHTGKRAVLVYVQDEDLFYEILEVFSAMKESSAVVLNSENLRAHLGRMPLFQGLWTQEPGGFSQIIAATVDKALTNEVVRQIETRTGGLDKRTGVMLTVHDLFYSAGSLAP